MQTQYLIEPEAPQVLPYDAEQMAQGLAERLAVFLFPLLVRLDHLLDKRLVRTFLQTIQVIIAYPTSCATRSTLIRHSTSGTKLGRSSVYFCGGILA